MARKYVKEIHGELDVTYLQPVPANQCPPAEQAFGFVLSSLDRCKGCGGAFSSELVLLAEVFVLRGYDLLDFKDYTYHSRNHSGNHMNHNPVRLGCLSASIK